jgi:saccharopine dehydrogenase-like NADP-dependent oxidoreductase
VVFWGDSLRDSFASRGFGIVENCLTIEEEYRQRVEAKVLDIFETHPTIAAIRNREAVTDLQLVALERRLMCMRNGKISK